MMRRGLLTISLVLVAMWLATPVAVLAHPHGAEPILFGIAPQQEPEKVREMWKPFFRYLEQEVGYRFAFETASSIEEFQQRVLEGRYDIWWGNPLTYVQASKRLGYVAIARITTRIAGLLVTLKEGEVKSSPKELAGKKIAYSAPDAIGGTSRSKLPRPCRRRAGPGQTVVHGLSRGGLSGSPRREGDGRRGRPPQLQRALEPAQREKLVVLAKTEEVAPQPFAVHPRLFRTTSPEIQRALLAQLDSGGQGHSHVHSVQGDRCVERFRLRCPPRRRAAAKIPY
jgi:phosphonate transport system substrate-binding protein